MTDSHDTPERGWRDHAAPDDLVALALADLEDQDRDELAHHLAGCEPCRAEYAALADAVEHLLAAAPQVAPPPGFDRAVLTAMGLTGVSEPEVRGGRRGWLRLAVPAVAAAVGLAIGVAGAAVVRGAQEQPQTVAVGPGLVTEDGDRVGTVLASWFDGRPVLVVTVADGRPGARYACELVLADGRRLPAGTWVLEGPSATWVVPRPEGSEVTAVELVTGTGRTWAVAEL